MRVLVLGLLVVIATSAAGWVGAGRASAVPVLAGRPGTLVVAERAIYDQLDPWLDFVGPLHTNSSGALTWSSVPGDDSGSVSCAPLRVRSFRCDWAARLLQSYRGEATVSFPTQERTPAVDFTRTTCVNPRQDASRYPNLCALDPVPGMAAS
jgi:hypothetical protein